MKELRISELEKMYEEVNFFIPDLAKKLNVSVPTAYSLLKKANIFSKFENERKENRKKLYKII